MKGYGGILQVDCPLVATCF